MKLQLDTTISFHRLMDCVDDEILCQYNELRKNAKVIHASTYSRKEFAFSLIRDCCSFQSRLIRTKSLTDAYSWIDKYGNFKKRFGPRIHAMFLNFILDIYGSEIVTGDRRKKNEVLTRRLIEYLRIFIPEMWERFTEDIDLPLTNRTQCPYANVAPIEQGEVYVLKTKRKCKSSDGCMLKKLMNRESKRAKKLLEELKTIEANDPKKTKELQAIESALISFYENGNQDIVFEVCNSGVGDLFIAIETHQDHALVTTNIKESSVISDAIGQNCIILQKP
jgi:hypothetical protein